MVACLYQENRFNLDPISPESVDTVFVPTSGTTTFGTRDYPKRRRIEKPSSYDEATFIAEHIASESSIYFRPNASATPRSLLWRILDDHRVLELKAIDLEEPGSEPSNLNTTLRLRLDNPIVPHGIAFAEARGERPAVIVHLITKRGEVVSITLRKEDFAEPRTLEESGASSRWFRTYTSNQLRIRNAYRLDPSVKGNILWVGLSDGGLLKLSRPDDQAEWKEEPYSDTKWSSSMRGFLSWKQNLTARYDDIDLMPKAASSICHSPSNLLVWTACLDHTLRAWGEKTRKVEMTLDLSGESGRDFNHDPSHLVDPNSRNQIKIIHQDTKREERYMLVTYSTRQRAFNFWSIREEGASDSLDVVVDKEFENFLFKPPIEELVNSVGSQVVDFHATCPRSRKEMMWQLWILVRSGSKSYTFTLKFDAEAPRENLAHTWQNEWIEVHSDPAKTHRLKNGAERFADTHFGLRTQRLSIIEQWLDWLEKPGNFSVPTLEAALAVFQRAGRNQAGRQKTGHNRGDLPFRQRILAVLSPVVPTVTFDTRESFAEQQKYLLEQLEIFNGVLEDLEKRREKSLSLIVDPHSGIPWLLKADQSSVVRANCDLEILHLNRNEYSQDSTDTTLDNVLLKALSDATTLEKNATVLQVMQVLKDSLSSESLQDFRQAFVGDVMRHTYQRITIESRLERLYDICGMGQQLNEDAFEQVNDAANRMGGFQSLDDESIDSFLRLFGASLRGRRHPRFLTVFGLRSLVSGAQSTIALELELILDVALLTTFMACDLEQDDLSSSFSAAEFYKAVTELARERIVLSWLSSTKFALKDHAENVSDPAEQKRHCGKTLLEVYFEEDWSNLKVPNIDKIDATTYSIRACAFIGGLRHHYEEAVPEIMSWLLKTVEIRITGQFLKFMPQTPWSAYVCGRYHVAASQDGGAATIFKAAAEKLSLNFNINDYDSGNLLTPDERNSFGDGFARYYMHIVDLFEANSVSSFANDFAKLALDEVERDDDECAQFQAQVISRLFTTSIQTHRFANAFQALSKQKDTALRRKSLQTFLEVVLAASEIDLLLHLPWPQELAIEADGHLAELCAKPQVATPSSSLLTDISRTTRSVPPHRLLYAWRIQRGDFRGAAEALWERTQMLKLSQSQGLRGTDIDAELTETYLSLINCLVLVEESMRWLLVRPVETDNTSRKTKFAAKGSAVTNDEIKRGTRRVVTVDDVRKEYQEHLDRVADLAAGRYPLELQYVADDDDEIMQEDTIDMAFGGLGRPDSAAGAMDVDVMAS